MSDRLKQALLVGLCILLFLGSIVGYCFLILLVATKVSPTLSLILFFVIIPSIIGGILVYINSDKDDF